MSKADIYLIAVLAIGLASCSEPIDPDLLDRSNQMELLYDQKKLDERQELVGLHSKWIEGQDVYEPLLDLWFKWIPPGAFRYAAHWVVITKGYWLSETEVAQYQWLQFADCGEKYWKGQFRGSLLPAYNVSPGDARWMAGALNAEYHSDLIDNPGRFDLPTEAEWLWASLGLANPVTRDADIQEIGQQTTAAELSRIAIGTAVDPKLVSNFVRGATHSMDYANLAMKRFDPSGNYHRIRVNWPPPLQTVNSGVRNGYGLAHMADNVSEWTRDVWTRSFPFIAAQDSESWTDDKLKELLDPSMYQIANGMLILNDDLKRVADAVDDVSEVLDGRTVVDPEVLSRDVDEPGGTVARGGSIWGYNESYLGQSLSKTVSIFFRESSENVSWIPFEGAMTGLRLARYPASEKEPYFFNKDEPLGAGVCSGDINYYVW